MSKAAAVQALMTLAAFEPKKKQSYFRENNEPLTNPLSEIGILICWRSSCRIVF